MTELLAGRYELIETVGKGATGRVWRGFDTLLHRDVAIKIVEIEGARDPAMAERFRREGVAIAGLSHDAIVKVFDAGTDAERGWLVMELLSGPNTNALVKQEGPLPQTVAMNLLARVADGLQAAHAAGITHRDVKPANIVLDAPLSADGTRPDLFAHPQLGRPVLVDFGIARIVDEAGSQLTKPATAIGTAAYMSPEQARGQDVNSASDIYSLGCLTYHLLLGRPPFVADSSLAVAHAQAFDTPVPLAELSPSVPDALNALVMRMLSKAPEHRPAAREVASELRAIVANPDKAPTVPLPPVGPGQATEQTALLDGLAAAPLAALVPASPTTPVAPADDLEPSPNQPIQPAAEASSTHTVRRIAVTLVILGLLSAIAYLWTTRDETPDPAPTVIVTTTATTTTQQQPTGEPSTAQTTTDPAPTQTDTQPPTTDAPAPTEPTQAPTTAPTTEAPTVPATTAAPPTQPVPVEPTGAPQPTEAPIDPPQTNPA